MMITLLVGTFRHLSEECHIKNDARLFIGRFPSLNAVHRLDKRRPGTPLTEMVVLLEPGNCEGLGGSGAH
jgi:hypothetical protein